MGITTGCCSEGSFKVSVSMCGPHKDLYENIHGGFIQNRQSTDLPGGPVVPTPCYHCQGPGSIPGRGIKIPQATRYSPKKRKKEKVLSRGKRLIVFISRIMMIIIVVFSFSSIYN